MANGISEPRQGAIAPAGRAQARNREQAVKIFSTELICQCLSYAAIFHRAAKRST
jgi:hypothetical protein